ncbi:MAG: DUF499 domain-containing protein [Syntrophomonadaceae bacterium]|nr:DUF499 domain-containing protein [Syntrophomonadaceae bacterium]
MLGLKLRDEFLSPHMRDTAIVFHRDDGSGALDQNSSDFLNITYPVADLQNALVAISTARAGLPVVLIGERGRGKSHIMAVLHHALAKPEEATVWLRDWGRRLGSEKLKRLELPQGFLPITEAVHNNEYEYLWDLIFERHPKGEKMQGKFEGLRQEVPPRSLLEEMFTEQPTALILDEFQTWFDGLTDEAGEYGRKRRTWTFNFIQNLSELAKDRPELFMLVVSVRNNQTDAYRQIHRDEPIRVDFRGATARQDRKQMVLHRLFDNRSNILVSDIERLTEVYATERYRLLYSHLNAGEKERIKREVMEDWPFSPELLELLEDQILLSETAQGSRDLIKVLAQVFRALPHDKAIITPADFSLDNLDSGVQSLVDALTDGGQERLREIACRNLAAVQEAGVALTLVRGMLSALWMRSLSAGNHLGGSREEIHLDLTGDVVIDDNFFNDELNQVKENSFNIHEEGMPPRLRFKLEENARARLLVSSRNDKHFEDGSDVHYLLQYLTHYFMPEASEPSAWPVVLGPNWTSRPWDEIEAKFRPEAWDRPALVVLPESPDNLNAILGRWLRDHLNKYRNTVRIILPRQDKTNIFADPDLMMPARAALLGQKWGERDSKYRNEVGKFRNELKQNLSGRYNRLAIIRQWNAQDPDQCTFLFEDLNKNGPSIITEVEEKIRDDIFALEDFEPLVVEAARQNQTIGALLKELKEPPVGAGANPIPYLGEVQTYEQILRIASSGRIYINVNGTWLGKKPEHSNAEAVLNMLKNKASKRGRELYEIILGPPEVVGSDAMASPATSPPLAGYGTLFPINPASNPTIAPPSQLPENGCQGEDNQVGIVMPGADRPENVPNGTPLVSPLPVVKRSEEKTILNLGGEFDVWGMESTRKIAQARLEFNGLTVQDIKQLLRRLPPTTRAVLEIKLPGGAE